MNVRIKFTVTQAHIEAARRAREDVQSAFSRNCPVALALAEETGAWRWSVSSKSAAAVARAPEWWAGRYGPEYVPSRATARFIRRFDEGEDVEPFRGSIARAAA